MANIYINEIYDKFRNGDPLSDEELDIGYAHFSKAADMLLPLGPRFDFAALELRRVADVIEGYIWARKRK